MKIAQQSRLAQNESGQALVEFALTITTTLLLIFGMIDFSRAVYAASILQWAAQDGARAAIVEPTQEVVEAAVIERMVGLDTDALEIQPLDVSEDNVVTVDVTYTFEFVAPIVAQIVGESIEMSASASMLAH